jgi:capsular exopolysaccharide synthesis family protein
LYFSKQGGSHHVIQLTGPSPNDGTSILAANLAVTIAQSGKRILLMDADLRRPRQHEIFGVSPQLGLGSIGEADGKLGDAIYKTVVDNLWLMPAGPLPADPSEVVMSPRFAELINRVRDQYEYVLIDTGPLLLVSDPCAVASRSDGVLLSLRLTKDSRRRAERAKEILDTLDAELIGVVATDLGGPRSRRYRNSLYGGCDGYFDEAGNGSPSRQKAS